MTELFQEKPNVVHIIVEDKTGKAERWATGRTLDEVLAELGGGDPVPKRRKRRTKAELAQARPATGDMEEPAAEPEGKLAEAKKRGRVMP
jgi:hypothetical protein